MKMKLSNGNDRVTVGLSDIKNYGKKPLVSNKRAHSGKMYVSTFGYDDVYKVTMRVEGEADMEKLLRMEKQEIYVSEWSKGEDTYLCKKIKIKKASYEYHWYYLEAELVKHFVRSDVTG